ncbi:MAG: UDP-2,3-diacylglucosamine diphosphatase [Nevskiales bacterium]
MSILFISDLHLEPGGSALEDILLRFLNGPARKAEALYLLGDIFEYWLGDDASLPRYQTVCDALAKLSAAGMPLYFMHGNRDFMVGKEFAQTTGATLLPESVVVDLDGTPTLLLHGDSLCTDDVEHQRFRKLALDPATQARLLALPIAQRENMALALRMHSKEKKSYTPQDIMDVNQGAVDSALRAHSVKQMLHGHTHRPAIHEWTLDAAPVKRIVLPDWHDGRGGALVCDARACRFMELL